MCCSIDDTAALLTNVEVRCILEQNRSGVGRARGERIDPRAEYIQNQVHLRPLNAENSECLLSPAAQVVEYIDSSQCKQTTAESIARFIDAVKTFGLTQAEMLQLVNHQPAQEVEIHTVGNSTQCSVASTAHPRALQMVEHCAERFPDEQVRPPAYRLPGAVQIQPHRICVVSKEPERTVCFGDPSGSHAGAATAFYHTRDARRQ